MKKTIAALLIVPLLIFLSCKKDSDEEAIKIENDQIGKYLDGTTVQFYKSIKIALRYSASAEKNPEIEKARNTMLRLGGKTITMGLRAVDTTENVNPLELLSLAKDFYSAKDVLIKTDEDSLPTILGNICYFTGGMKSSAVPDIGGFRYDKNFEHGVIGLLWFASVKGPKEFTFYELHKTNEDEFSQYDLSILTKLIKSLIYCENEFPYNGLQRADQSVSLIEKNKEMIIRDPLFSFTDKQAGGEQTYYQYHAMGSVLKGINQKKIGREEEALKDFEVFLSDAEKGGLDNELTWMIGSYVSIKKEDKEKSIAYLTKLEKSELIDEPERKAISEIRTYIEGRENGKALNVLSDKFAYGKIAFKLTKRRIESAKAIEALDKTPEGQKFRELHRELDEKSSLLNSFNVSSATDSLAGKAGDFVKGLFSK